MFSSRVIPREARDLTIEAQNTQGTKRDLSACAGARSARNDGANYFGTIPTKSRTDFCSEIENALPFSRANQNALDDPPSRFSARSIFKSSASDVVARIFANSASETPEQTPTNARLLLVVAAKVRRARWELFKPLMGWPRSTRNGPH